MNFKNLLTSIFFYFAIVLFVIAFPSLSGMTGRAFAQSQFQRTIGGTGDDIAFSIIRTTDGGYAATGYYHIFGDGTTMYIAKLDASGIFQWNRIVAGGITQSIIQTTDGGYAAAGYASLGLGNNDMYIVKLDASGTLQWSRTVGGTNLDLAWSIVQTTDGGYAVAGWASSFGAGNYDMYIVKLDASGTLQWSRTVGGTNFDVAQSIVQATDGGYAVAGYTESFGAGNTDMYIVKLDAGGMLQWSRTVGGTEVDNAWSITQSTDGGYVIAGRTWSFGTGNGDMYIVKLNATGTLQWTRTVGGASEDIAHSIIRTTDCGFAAAGYTYSFGAGSTDMYIVKLDSGGTLQWSKAVGGSSNDYAYSIIQATDGGYAVAGYTVSFGAGGFDMYIVKLDASGNTCGNSSSPPSISGSGGTLGTPTSTVNLPTSTVTMPTPAIYTGGTLTTLCFVGIQPISNEIPDSYKLHQNYPNPFNASSKIKIQISKLAYAEVRVFDITGKLITVLLGQKLTPGEYETTFDGNDLPSGVYLYSLIVDGNLIDTKKIMLLK